MSSPTHRRDLSRIVIWLALVAAVIFGQPAQPDAGAPALRVRFPGHASRVLGDTHGSRFVERDGRFVLAVATAPDLAGPANVRPGRPGLTASFPLTSDGLIELTLTDGFSVRIRERNLRGRGRPEAGALVYPHESGAVFWTFDRRGYEEWLLLERPRAGVVAAWEVIGASAAVRGERVAILDDAGRTRVSVSAPAAFGADGSSLKATLGVRQNVIELALDDDAARQRYVLVDPLWNPVGSLDTTRVGNTATLLSTGKVLVAGGFGSQASPSNYVELYDPATGVWSDASPMNQFRAEHTATLLHDGQVLVVAGFNDSVKPTNTAELYDPVTGTWTPTGSLTTARRWHSATLLADGRVLIAGGTGASNADLTSCEIYDPASGTFSGTGPLLVTRSSHVAVRLGNGKVLAAGGRPTTSAELFDPQTGLWAWTGFSTAVHFFGHTATLMNNGRVLVAGGTGPGGSPDEQSAAEIYRPSNGTWTPTTPLPIARVNHTATLLPNGNVLVAGGYTNTTDSDAKQTQVYRVGNGVWEAAGALNHARFEHTATLLPDGRVLLAGGKWSPAAPAGTEIFTYPELAELDPVGPMTTPRRFHTVTPLPDGKVLVVGGQDFAFQTQSTAELFDPVTGVFQPTGSLSVPRQRHTATLLPSGHVLVAGGSSGSTYHASAELYDPALGSWKPTGTLGAARESHTATLLADGRVLVAGGSDANGALQSVELYDPGGTWKPAAALGTPRSGHTATLLRTNNMLVVGGNAGLASAEIYVAGKNGWLPTGPMPADHNTKHTATLLPNGRVLVVAGLSAGLPTEKASLFIPANGKWSATDTLADPRSEHTATLLPSGRVLIAGGNEPTNNNLLVAFSEEYEAATASFRLSNLIPTRQQAAAALMSTGQVLITGGNDTYFLGPPKNVLSSADAYDEGRGAPASITPTLMPLSPATASPGEVRLLAGTVFTRPHTAASGRGASDSPTNYPLVMLQRQDNEAVSYAPVSLWGVSFVNLDLAEATLPADLQPGWHHVRVIVNGVASASRPLLVQ